MNKKTKITLLFLIILSVPSIFKFIHRLEIINEFNSVNSNFHSVDLSNIKVEGYKLGDEVHTLDFREKYPNDPFFSKDIYNCEESINGDGSYQSTFFMKDCKIIKLSVTLPTYETYINDKKVNSSDEIIKILGEGYITEYEEIPHALHKNIYIDKENNLELYVSKTDNIELQKIEKSRIENYLLFKKFQIIDLPSLIFEPIIYFIFLIPSLLAILYKQHRKFNIILQICIFSILAIIYFRMIYFIA